MIELSGIQQRFGTQTVLDSVDFTVRPGESVAIVGESGSGKSTLARILLRLRKPTAGSYTFDGQNVLDLRGRDLQVWRRNVQAVFQNPWQSLDPRMRIDKLLTEPLNTVKHLSRQETRNHAGELLERVGLGAQLAERYPRELSGGQRQRIAIARAISINPRLLVLDEPVSALDVSLRAQILNLLRDLVRDSGTSVVYITHDLATVSYLCSRAYVLYQGSVMEQLATRQLASAPDNPYTQLLASSVLTVDGGRRSPIERDIELSTGRGGCPFAGRCPHTTELCLDQKPELHSIGTGEVSWESRCHYAGQLVKGGEARDRIAG